MIYKRFILDVDGVMTDGKLYWDAMGQKPFKAFGTYDTDGLKVLREYIDIQFISADTVGFDVTASRVRDYLGFPLTIVKEHERLQWVLSQGNPSETIFMGDGPHDAAVLRAVGFGIAPSQAYITAIQAADYVTQQAGGSGAVMAACVMIMNKMGINHDF